MWDFSFSPSCRREVFTQADLFCFGAEVWFFLSPPFSSLPVHFTVDKCSRKAKRGREKQTHTLELDPDTDPKAQAVVTEALLGVHRAKSTHPDPALPRSWAAPDQPLCRSFLGLDSLAAGSSTWLCQHCEHLQFFSSLGTGHAGNP